MSNKLLPTFQGWSFEKTKTPIWKNTIYEADSGKETRCKHWSYPRYSFSLKHTFMTDNAIKSVSLDKGDLELLQGFFNSVGGTFEDFLYLDDVENTAINQAFGVGDGLTIKFQLARSLPNWIEPVKGIIEKPDLFINNVATQDFTFDNTGKIIFSTPPINGSILTWSGQYYFRVRFQEDSIELTRTFEGLWENITINLITVK